MKKIRPSDLKAEHGGSNYHDHWHGGSNYHDHWHGGSNYHDHWHGGSNYHDHWHGGSNYHDHWHGGSNYHDHWQGNAIHNVIHNQAHVVSCIAGEMVTEEGDTVNRYVRFGSNDEEDLGLGYFYNAGPDKPQWGYFKITKKERLKPNGDVEVTHDGGENIKDVILFVNDRRVRTKANERNRKLYYRIKTVPVSFGSTAVDMAIAHHFDHVPPRPLFPRRHKWDDEGAPQSWSLQVGKDDASDPGPSSSDVKLSLFAKVLIWIRNWIDGVLKTLLKRPVALG